MSTINYTIRKNDTARTLTYNLLMDGAAIDLTTATNVILNWNNGDNVFHRTASIDSPVSGSVSYDLVAADVAKAGVVYADFTINYTDGTILRVPTEGHILIDIRENSEGVTHIHET